MSALKSYLDLPMNSYYGEIIDEWHNMERVDVNVPITSKSRSGGACEFVNAAYFELDLCLWVIVSPICMQCFFIMYFSLSSLCDRSRHFSHTFVGTSTIAFSVVERPPVTVGETTSYDPTTCSSMGLGDYHSRNDDVGRCLAQTQLPLGQCLYIY